MAHVNDQQPFDVEPDDDRRRAANAGQQQHEQAAASEPALEPAPSEDSPAADGPAAGAQEAHPARRRHQRVAALGVAAAVIFTAGAGGGAVASLALARSTTATSADGGSSVQQTPSSGSQGFGGPQGESGGTQGGFGGSRGGFGQGGFGSGSDGSGSGSSTSTDTTAATADQIQGLVTVVSQLGYEDGESAGTGIVLTSNGRILTNNHVIEGSTSVKVTVQSTGASYTADVVGTDKTKDVAVLQLEHASGLTAADIATSDAKVGDDITAVGNANGTGTLSAAEGTVSAVDQTITTSSEGGTAGETLHGLIELDADVVSGDSGGAVENADGDVVGVTTAASSGTSDITGYAIPIDTALDVARQIVAGNDTAAITIGLPAFLGVSLSTSTSGSTGAVVGEVLDGTPAAATDLAAGDVITRIDGTSVSSGSELSAAIAAHQPGDRVQVGYTDASGASHTVTVTLTEGPAD